MKTVEIAIEDTKKNIEEEKQNISNTHGNSLDMLEVELKALEERKYLLFDAIANKYSPRMMWAKITYIVTNIPFLILVIYSMINEIDVLIGISLILMSIAMVWFGFYIKLHVRKIKNVYEKMIAKSVAEIDDFIREFGGSGIF